MAAFWGCLCGSMTAKGVTRHQLAHGILRGERLPVTLAVLALQALPQRAGEWRAVLLRVACGRLLQLLLLVAGRHTRGECTRSHS